MESIMTIRLAVCQIQERMVMIMSDNKAFFEHLTPDMLEGVSGGTGTPTSDKVFQSLIVACKKGGKSKDDLAKYFMNAEALYNTKGMEGVTPEDALQYLDEHWD